MADSKSHIDYELISKFLAEEATTAEVREIELWINASEANRQTFDQLRKLWRETGRIIPHGEAAVNVDRGWNILQNRIRNKPDVDSYEKDRTPVRKLFYNVSRIAAVLVLGFAIYWIYQNWFSGAQKVQLIATNQMLTDTLPDGSVISLNKRSKLAYPEKFSGNYRLVSLTGEGFFDIKHDPEKPFAIEVNNATITVLGTSFYIRSYDSLTNVEVGVEKGTVQLKSSLSDNAIILKGGQMASLDKSSGEISPVLAFNPNAVYWKTQTLIFQNTRLGEVFSKLEALYNVSIDVKNETVLECRLSAKFKGETVRQILDTISASFDLQVSGDGSHFTISGNGC